MFLPLYVPDHLLQGTQRVRLDANSLDSR